MIMAKKNFRKELDDLCKKHKISGFVACVCEYNKKYDRNEHNIISYGEEEHVDEIISDFIDIVSDDSNVKNGEDISYIQ